MIKLFLSVLLTVFCSAILYAQQLNRQMKVESLDESSEIINPEKGKVLIIVRSQVSDLVFDANRNLEVKPQAGGVWYVYFSPGTIRLKITAKGYEQLEIPPRNFAGGRTYTLRLLAVSYAPASRADENLFEVNFQCNEDSVYSSYGSFVPMLSKSKIISYKLPQGEYTFHFQKEAFAEEIRTLNVTQAIQIILTLKPASFSEKRTLSLPGIIVITSDPNGSEILLDGQKIGNTPYQGELIAGDHRLELRKPLYYPNISTFALQEGKTQSLALKLRPHFGYLTVTSTVQGSQVSLDGKPAGSAPLKRREVESTKHTLRVEAQKYHPYIEEFSIGDEESKTITATLKAAFGTLELASLPEDSAGVDLDGQRVGVTPYTSKLTQGKYVLKVTKEFYNDVEEEIILAEGETLKKTVTLPKNFGELKIKAPQSTILVNGTNVGIGAYHARLAPGRYQLQATRGNLYVPAQKEIFLSVGEQKDISLEPSPRLGSLSVFVEPVVANDAEIYVGNEPKGKAPLVLPLLIGDYTITARKVRFLDASKNVTIKENEKGKVTFALKAGEKSNMVFVQGGTFTMGSPTGVGDDDEQPQHSVTLSDFYIDRYEVTYKIWKEVRDWAQNNGYTDLPSGRKGYNGTDDHPVTQVSWYDIVKWCNARSQKEGLTPVYCIKGSFSTVYYTNSSFSTLFKTGQTHIQNTWVNWSANGYRLPTEAEWEYAARGGNQTHSYTYSGSNTVRDVAWYSENSGSTTHKIGTKQPNELGIYDMSGNVFEWCWDWYESYSSSLQTNPLGPTSGSYRLLRGISWAGGDIGLPRVADRSFNEPDSRDNDIGFRSVKTKN